MGDFDDIERLVEAQAAAHHPTDSEWFWCELGLITGRWNPSHHPFFVRWSEGDLALRELQMYAAEFDHLLAASAATAAAARDKSSGLLTEVLCACAGRATEDVELWLAFAREVGWRGMSAWHYAADPFTATIECAGAWGPPAQQLAADLLTLNAIEALQLQVAGMAAEALGRFYGLAHGAGADYFRRHADPHQSLLLQSALQGALDSSDPFALISQADAVCRSYWGVLDAIERFELA